MEGIEGLAEIMGVEGTEGFAEEEHAGEGQGGLAEGLDSTGFGYADAMAELEQILEDLENGDIDVDVLAAQVERAAYLIDVCRQRIAKARMKVESVVVTLDPSQG